MLVVDAGAGAFGAFFAEDAELFCFKGGGGVSCLFGLGVGGGVG